MLTKHALHSLFRLEVSNNSPLIEIYSEQITPRLEYTCNFIFTHVLNLRFQITDKLEDSGHAKNQLINYSEKTIPGALQIVPGGLLFAKGLGENRPRIKQDNKIIYLYPNESKTSGGSELNFDVFSAVFYSISRMEEWQAYTPDSHQRFEAASSLFFKEGLHLKPVVDFWILELKKALEKKYPAIKFPEKKFKAISTIDVDNLYAYKSKGVLRTVGAYARDLLKFDFKNLGMRSQVLIGKQKDPFDIYETVSDFCFEQKIPLIYFFLFRTGTKHDRTVDPSTGAYKEVFNTLKRNHALFGLHPSYDSAYEKGMLSNEMKELSSRSGETINLSRQHYLRFDIRSTPQLLLKNGILADFTMGFASTPGFRAGTSHPFYYYDFHAEAATELLFVPFCAMDGAYTVYENTDPSKAMESMRDLAKEVKKVGGLFITVFHERTFFDHLYKGFGTLYNNLHLQLKEL